MEAALGGKPQIVYIIYKYVLVSPYRRELLPGSLIFEYFGFKVHPADRQTRYFLTSDRAETRNQWQHKRHT
jgi:hypothetical protein